MSEVLTQLVVTGVAVDLSARAAQVARAVADVIDERCSPESGGRDAAGFLREWAGTIGNEPRRRLEDPLDRLRVRFALADDEVDLLLLAGLPDEHEGLATTFRSLHPQGEPRATAGLAALLLGGGPEHRARIRHLLSAGGAVRHRLLRLDGRGPFFERSLLLAEELWLALHGCDAWPAAPVRVRTDGPPPGLDAWCDRPDVRDCVAALRRGARSLVLVPHEDPTVGAARCQAIADAAGWPVVGASVDASDRDGISLVLAHAAIRGAAPLLVVPEGASRVPVALGDYPGTVLVTAPPGAVHPSPDRALLTADGGPVPLAALRAAWSAAIPGLDGRSAVLAARHPIDPAVTAQLALDLAATARDPDLAHVSGVVRRRAGVTLPSGALLIRPHVGWDRLVLPQEATAQLHAAVDRLDQQATVLDEWGMRDRAQLSPGVRMLLTGPPGTGKSLSAAALATAVDTDLMVIDVSRLVSKWLGETEKNLAAAFEAAERTRAVLLFDEADALFSARTEVSDAHDRYANLETAYLLQRMERFDGLVVLTSNLRHNIDPAFTRRLDFVVELPLPDVEGRIALWQRYLPGNVTAEDLDVPALARLYPVPGGWIRNAAVAAAFEAAASGKPITQQRLVETVRREYRKASTPFPGEPPRRRNDHV